MSTLMQWREEAQLRKTGKYGNKPDGDCVHTDVRFLAGSGVTDGAGQWSLDVPTAVCDPIGSVQAVSFVATTTYDPETKNIPEPSHAMTGHTGSGGFLTLHVRTFTCRCEPKPYTPFDYHAAIAYVFVAVDV